MAQYQGQGDAAYTLMEEAAEVIQVIAKMKRFNGNWDEIPPGKDKTRWEMLVSEMNDLMLAWNELCQDRHDEITFQNTLSECSFGTLHRLSDVCTCAEDLSAADFWDGDNSASE